MSSHLKKFTHAQIAKKATQRAHDVPEYKAMLMQSKVREDKDGVIIDTQSETWKRLLAMCQAADERAKATAATASTSQATPPPAAAATSTPSSAVPTPSSTPTPPPSATTTPLARQASLPTSNLTPTIAQPIRAQSGNATVTAPTPTTAVPTPTPTPPPQPSQSLPPPAAPLAHSSSIERLFSKAANSLRQTMSKDKDKDKEKEKEKERDGSKDALGATQAQSIPTPEPARRSETPDPGTYITPSSSARSGSVSLSSSPQVTPGAFLPPPSVPSSSSNLPPRVVRTMSTSSVNPFISSLPPPMLPSPSPAMPIPAPAPASTSSSLASSPAAASTANTPSSSSAVNFFKKLVQELETKVQNEINGGSQAAASSTSSGASSEAPPPFPEPQPVSGPFPQPVLSPMLTANSALSRSPALAPRSGVKNGGGKSEVDDFASALPPTLHLAPALGKKKAKKRASEIVQIARAPAAPLPTPFQAEPRISEEGGAPGEGASAEDEGGRAEEELEQQRMILSASPSAARKLRKVKEGGKKKRASAMAKLEDGSAATAAAVSSSPPALSSVPPSIQESHSAAVSSPAPVAATTPIILAPIPLAAVIPPVVDGIDLADLVDEEPVAAPEQSAAQEGAGEGEGEGEQAQEEGEGDSGSTLTFALVALNHTVREALTEFEETIAPAIRSSSKPVEARFLPMLQELIAASTILREVRRERFGILGCEEASCDPLDEKILPEYARSGLQAVAAFAEQHKVARLHASSMNTTLEEFIQSWFVSFDDSLVEPNDAMFSSQAHPSSFPPAIVEMTQRLMRKFMDLVSEASADLQHQVQEVFLILLQVRLRQYARRSQSAWQAKDFAVFLKAFAPCFHRMQALEMFSRYRLREVLEQLYDVLGASNPTASAGGSAAEKSLATIEQRIVSSKPNLVTHAFQLLAKEKDSLLACRLLPKCFAQLSPGPWNITSVPAAQQAIDYAAANYPAIQPWLIASYLGIASSLYFDDGLESIRDRPTFVSRKLTDLSSTPVDLIYRPVYLEPTAHAAAQSHSLDVNTQAYHMYLHYLRSLLGVYEVARKDPEIVLEYIRLCLTFSRKHMSLLLRRWSERFINPLAGDQDPTALVPVRDAHQPGYWPLESTILTIVQQPEIYAIDEVSLSRFFLSVGFIRGFITLAISGEKLLGGQRRARMVQCCLLALCSDDVEYFEQSIDAGILSADTALEHRVEMWRAILDQSHAMTVSPEAVRIVPKRLTLPVLLSHLLASIGSALTVTLLLSHPPYIELCDRANLPASFYTDILEHAVLRSDQHALGQQLMDRIDSHLWSDRTKNIPENTRAVWQAEINARSEELTSDGSTLDDGSVAPPPAALRFLFESSSRDATDGGRKTRGRGASTSDAIRSRARGEFRLKFDWSQDADEPSSRPLVGERWYEDMSNGSHWGTIIDLNEARCAECANPLQDMRHSSNSVIHTPAPNAICAFRCSHLSHLSCSIERACTRCLPSLTMFDGERGRS